MDKNFGTFFCSSEIYTFKNIPSALLHNQTCLCLWNLIFKRLIIFHLRNLTYMIIDCGDFFFSFWPQLPWMIKQLPSKCQQLRKTLKRWWHARKATKKLSFLNYIVCHDSCLAKLFTRAHPCKLELFFIKEKLSSRLPWESFFILTSSQYNSSFVAQN